MLIRRTVRTAIVAAALTLTVSGCGDEDTRGVAPVATPSSSATPSPTPTWADAYTAEELAEYDKALARWTEYENRSAPLWANPAVTPTAQELLREYWVTWPNQLNTLRYYAENGRSVKERAEVLWSRLGEVSKTRSGYSIAIEQCVDPSTAKVEYPSDVSVKPPTTPPPVYLKVIKLSEGKKTDGVYKVLTVKDLAAYAPADTSDPWKDVPKCDG